MPWPALQIRRTTLRLGKLRLGNLRLGKLRLRGQRLRVQYLRVSHLGIPLLGVLLLVASEQCTSAQESGTQPLQAPTSALPQQPSTRRSIPPTGATSPSQANRAKLNDSLPLLSSRKTSADQGSLEPDGKKKPSSSLLATLFSIASSLTIVLGLFLLCIWLLRKATPKGSGRLPEEVLEVLGQAPLAARQNVHLIRLGHKLVLVHISTTGVETLTEIDNPVEVDRLAGLCKQSAPESSSSIFRNVLQQFSREPTEPGFLGESTKSNAELANRDSRNQSRLASQSKRGELGSAGEVRSA